MKNNIEIIKPLLKFDNENEFYFIQVLQRSKENPDLGKNNRLLKAYYVYSIEYLDKIYPELVKMANEFNARVYIHLNRRNAYQISLEMLEDLAHSIKCGQIHSLDKIYNSACGRHHSEKDKTWIIDIDEQDLEEINLNKLKENVNSFIEPFDERDKIIAEIPTKNGIHLISTPFNSQKFGEIYPNIQVHKNNPTILYCP